MDAILLLLFTNCRAEQAVLNGQIDVANAELAQAQQAAQMKGQDLQQLERRRDNLHQQVGLQAVLVGLAPRAWPMAVDAQPLPNQGYTGSFKSFLHAEPTVLDT